MRAKRILCCLATGLLFVDVLRARGETPTPAPPPTIAGESLLVVVHAYKGWDQHETAKSALDRVVAEQKKKKTPVVYLLDSKDPVYLADKTPDHALQAPVGQFDNKVDARRVTLAGGNWSFCLSNALGSVLANNSQKHVTVTIPMDAAFIFMSKKNVAAHYAAMTEKERTDDLTYEFQTIVDRYLKDRVCLTIHYDRKKIATTKGKCERTADIFLESTSVDDKALPRANETPHK